MWDLIVAPLLLSTIGLVSILFAISLVIEKKERLGVAAPIVFGLLLRLCVMYFYHIILGDPFTIKDDVQYDRIGLWLAEEWRQGNLHGLIEQDVYDTHYGFYYLVASLYYFFGHNPLIVKTLNCVIGAFNILLAYIIAYTLFDKKTAKITAWLTCLYTGFYLPCVLVLKDTMIILIIQIIMIATFWFKRGKIMCGVVLAFAFPFLQDLRMYAAYMLGILLAWDYLIPALALRFQKQLRILVVCGIVLAIYLYRDVALDSLGLPMLFQYGEGSYLNTVFSETELYSPSLKTILVLVVSSPITIVFATIMGVLTTLIAPYAWLFPGMSSEIEWSVYYVSFPGMWVWYLVFPFAVFSVKELAHRWRSSPGIRINVAFSVVMLIMLAVIAPRESRHRDMVMPMFLMFASSGIIYAKKYAKYSWVFYGFLGVIIVVKYWMLKLF